MTDTSAKNRFMTGEELLKRVREASRNDVERSPTPVSDAVGASGDLTPLFGLTKVTHTVDFYDEDGSTGRREITFSPPTMRSYLRATGSFIRLLTVLAEADEKLSSLIQRKMQNNDETPLSILDIVRAVGTVLETNPDAVLNVLSVFMPEPYDKVENTFKLTPVSLMDSVTIVIILLDLERLIDAFRAARVPVLAAIARAKSVAVGRQSEGTS